MAKFSVKEFLNTKIITKDVGEETYLTWKETLSYAIGRGAQGMNTSMTSSKYINFFLTNVLFKKLSDPMGVASKIRFFCGIFDAINDPMMGVIVDKTRTKDGQMRPYIKWAPIFVSIVMVLFFIGSADASPLFNIIYTTILFVGLDVTYTAFDIPMGRAGVFNNAQRHRAHKAFRHKLNNPLSARRAAAGVRCRRRAAALF